MESARVTPASSTWIVGDDQAPGPGQRRRRDFLREARQRVEAAVEGIVGSFGFRAIGCPYLAAVFDRLEGANAAEIEAAARRYAGGAADASEALTSIATRATGAAATWVAAGRPLEPSAVAGLVLPFFPGLPAAMPVQGDAGPGAVPAGAVPRGGAAPDAAVRSRVEPLVGMSLGHARVRSDGRAVAAAGGRGFTVGNQVVLDPSFRAGTLAGDALLAHELVHVAQQTRGGGAAPGAAHEDEADTLAAAAMAGLPARASRLGAPLRLQRCDETTPSAPTETRADKLKKLVKATDAVVAQGSAASFGELAAAHAEHQLYQHELSVLETGTGIYTGNKSTEHTGGKTPAGVVASDCTELVYEILGKAFKSAGQDATWTKVKAQARANTKARGKTELIGVDLLAALQSDAGWKGVFWAPDPKFAYKKSDGTDETEHGYAYDVARSAAGPKSKRGYYYKQDNQPGVRVDKLAVNFSPEQGSTTKADAAALASLKALPFGVIAARGGRHMAILAHGKVIEIHWKQESKDVTTIEGTPIESWAWDSGAIVAPAADVAKAFP